MRYRFGIPLLAVLLLSAPAAPGESKKDHGRELFQEKGCAYCHQIGGVGGVKGPALDGIGKRRTKKAIEDQIRNGSLLMPAFGEALTAQEVDAIAEFLHRSMPVPTAASVAAPLP